LAGDHSDQTRQDAFQALGLMSLTGMAHMMRHGDGSGGNHGMHMVSGLADDLLQPDDVPLQTKRARAPCAFGLELKY
jgi:hypothetical protein